MPKKSKQRSKKLYILVKCTILQIWGSKWLLQGRRLCLPPLIRWFHISWWPWFFSRTTGSGPIKWKYQKFKFRVRKSYREETVTSRFSSTSWTRPYVFPTPRPLLGRARQRRVWKIAINRFSPFFSFGQVFLKVILKLIQNPLSVLKSEHGKCLKKRFLSTGSAVWPPSGPAGNFFSFFPKSTGKLEPNGVVRESLR